MLYMQLEDRGLKLGAWFPWALAGLAFSSIAVYLMFNFYALFLTGMVSGIILVVVNGTFLMRIADCLTVTIFKVAMGFTAVGVMCWVVDHNLCQHAQWMNLHTIWHVGVGFAAYLLTLCH